VTRRAGNAAFDSPPDPVPIVYKRCFIFQKLEWFAEFRDGNVGGVVRNVVTPAGCEPFGPLTKYTHGNGLVRDCGFDTDGALALQNLSYTMARSMVVSFGAGSG
jgi:hypothetical protein